MKKAPHRGEAEQNHRGSNSPPALTCQPIIGLRVRLDRRVDRELGCHDNLAAIFPGRGPHAAQLRCAECQRHRGWLGKLTADFLTETVRTFGVPLEPRDATTTAIASATAPANGDPPMATRDELYPSKYLKAADLKGKPVGLIIDRVTQETLEANGKKDVKPVVHFRNTAKLLVLNLTNYVSIADQHGDETNNWPGCKIVVYPTTTLVGNKQKDCIRVEEKTEPEKEGGKPPPRDDMDDVIPFALAALAPIPVLTMLLSTMGSYLV
jgi:hypothetical protein